jgi:hypothetical protein
MSRRHLLILGKFPIVEITRSFAYFIIVLDLGNSHFIRTTCPLTSDVRKGDLLTLYTEVLQETPHA